MENTKPRLRTWFCAAPALALLLSAAPARAQAWTPRTQGNRLGGDSDVVPGLQTKLFDVSFIGQVRLTRHVYLDFDLPWGFAAPQRGTDDFVLGNPTVGAHYATMLGRHVAFYVGGTVSVPTHLRIADSAGGAAAALAIASRAYDDFYRFEPEYVDVLARAGVELAFRPLFMRFDTRPVVMLPVGHDFTRVELTVLQGNEFELLSDAGVGGGVRLQAVFFPTARNVPDRAQLAFEPYFAYEPEPRGFFARAGVLFAADPPLGIGFFDRNHVTTIRVTMGGKW